MCGIVGIVGNTPVNQSIYDALTVLQHRGQDAAGIVTIDDNRFRLRKANGLVQDVFQLKHMQRLQGQVGIGHVRYPTAGSSSASEAQPFYVNSPYGITLAHNGNLTNAEALRQSLFEKDRRHLNTTSDSEILLNVLAHQLSAATSHPLTVDDMFTAVKSVHRQVSGAYAVVAMVIGHGVIAFRDPKGIRPLCLGKRDTQTGTEYMVASETVALDAVASISFVMSRLVKRFISPWKDNFILVSARSHRVSTRVSLSSFTFLVPIHLSIKCLSMAPVSAWAKSWAPKFSVNGKRWILMW